MSDPPYHFSSPLQPSLITFWTIINWNYKAPNATPTSLVPSGLSNLGPACSERAKFHPMRWQTTNACSVPLQPYIPVSLYGFGVFCTGGSLFSTVNPVHYMPVHFLDKQSILFFTRSDFVTVLACDHVANYRYPRLARISHYLLSGSSDHVTAAHHVV